MTERMDLTQVIEEISRAPAPWPERADIIAALREHQKQDKARWDSWRKIIIAAQTVQASIQIALHEEPEDDHPNCLATTDSAAMWADTLRLPIEAAGYSAISPGEEVEQSRIDIIRSMLASEPEERK